MSVKFNSSDFTSKLGALSARLEIGKRKIMIGMADAVLTISNYEVPFDKGRLSGSGGTDMEGDKAIAYYNTEYAAVMHEGMRRDGTHVVRKYRNGRKSKYLEDPIKMNLAKFQEVALNQFRALLK